MFNECMANCGTCFGCVQEQKTSLKAALLRLYVSVLSGDERTADEAMAAVAQARKALMEADK